MSFSSSAASGLPEYRQYVRRALEFDDKSVKDCFHRGPTFGEQEIRRRWRSETTSRIDCEAKEYLTPSHRSYQEHKKYEGHYYRNISAADEDQECDSASNYWKMFG